MRARLRPRSRRIPTAVVRITPSLPCCRAGAWPRVRQVRDNGSLKTDFRQKLPAVSDSECSVKVESCGEQYKNGVNCRRFYKCIDEAENGGKVTKVAYSCQNPKVFQSMCSGKYWGKGGTDKYLCTGYNDLQTRGDVQKRYGFHLKQGQGVEKYNADMCRA